MLPCRRFAPAALLLWTAILPARSAPRAAVSAVVPREGVAISRVGTHGRAAVHTDPVEASLVAGRWAAPKAGDLVALPGGSTRAWSAVRAGADGAFPGRDLEGGYLYVAADLPADRTMLLDAQGHSMVYVNGEPRAGDPYQTGYVRLPVRLHRGRNDLLFRSAGRALKLRLTAAPPEAWLDTADATLPDVTGVGGRDWAAVVVGNATDHPRRDLFITARSAGPETLTTRVPVIGPMTVRKVGFSFALPASLAGETFPVNLELRDTTRGQTLSTARIVLRIRRPGQTYKRTFISGIDGSFQYYAVNPAGGRSASGVRPSESGSEPPGPRSGRPPNAEGRPALFLTLHGAGVEAIGQADAYEAKSWGDVVAPTNRRPYGFDWEDWGRLDAMEVLQHAREELHSDPARIYLTGHSMGGHGTWSIGATFPGQFAAIGPSAGWISFQSYAGARPPANPSPVEAMLARAASPSDTLALERNYAQEGVYVLHGEADDNVPVTEARAMRQRLALFHQDFRYHEQPGAGHWWDASDEPGTDCVDWAPMFDFFAHHALPDDEQLRQIDFVTMSPGVSAWCHWAGIIAQLRPFRKSSVSIRCDPGKRRFVGSTQNVAEVALDLSPIGFKPPDSVELDGQRIGLVHGSIVVGPSAATSITFVREDGKWIAAPQITRDRKNQQVCGPFKHAFRNRMILVYGTRGTPVENRATYARARFDAEGFWYRGNGSVDLVADAAFDAAAERGRNVILYGNAETNAVWAPLLGGSPIQVHRDAVTVGARRFIGANLGCLFVRPKRDGYSTEVGVVAGTGTAGLRLTEGLPYFLSGGGYPDCFVVGPEMLEKGAAGVRAAGFFGIDWSVEHGEFAWGAGGGTP